MVKKCRFDGDLKLFLTFLGNRQDLQEFKSNRNGCNKQGSTIGVKPADHERKPRRNVGKPFYLRLREMVFCWLMGVP